VAVPFDAEHLVTTQGDAVRIWDVASAIALLRPIDTAAEALWVLANRSYRVTCGAPVTRTDAGFQIANVAHEQCLGTTMVDVTLGPDGTITETRVPVSPAGVPKDAGTP
jgi:hypothetical protein